MKQIPKAALYLGLAGLIPFIWGAVNVLYPPLANWTQMTVGGRFAGPFVQIFYGTVILSFMSGVLWGFAAKSQGASAYVLSVIPALWAFLMISGGPVTAATNLIFGFLGLLLLDWYFWQHGLAPAWWMHFRALLTAVVVASLLLVVI